MLAYRPMPIPIAEHNKLPKVAYRHGARHEQVTAQERNALIVQHKHTPGTNSNTLNGWRVGVLVAS